MTRSNEERNNASFRLRIFALVSLLGSCRKHVSALSPGGATIRACSYAL
jgi:hypothetical protein